MATQTWITNGGSFATASNWSGNIVPSPADTAVFGSGSGTITGAGNVATLNLTAGGPWTWAGTVTANNYNVNDATTLSTGTVWTLAGTPANANYVVIGGGAGGSGNLTVSNGASLISTQAANTVSYGLFVGSGSSNSSNGSLTVTGAGSAVNTGANGAAVGRAGTGTLTVQSGASATFATSDSSIIAALAVGLLAGSSGTVDVSGSGSSVTANGFVTFGRAGTGALNVTGGATFTGGAAASGATGTFAVALGDSNAASSATPLFGGTATAQVTTGGTLRSLGNLDIGYNGSTGSLVVDGSGSVARADSTIQVGGGTTRTGGVASLTVRNGGTARSGTASNGNAGISIGSGSGSTGTAAVTGTGSLLDANGYRLSIGTSSSGVGSGTSTGTLTISGGGRAMSGASYTDTEAALALGAATGTSGTLSITGAGSQLVASGAAVIGGNNSGSGVVKGGTGVVTVTGGGLLQTGAITIQSGSSVTIDQASTLTAPSVTLNGGTADLYTLSASTTIGFGSGGTLKVHAVTGANAISNFTFGDQIDFVGASNVTLGATSAAGLGGTISFAAAPANASYQQFSDGSGGTIVALTPKTIGVYRFFDTNFGTHFYTADANEAATVGATRSDLTAEGTNGIGLQAVAVSASDPNASAVYRFFDSAFGTHFFTASASERDTIIATRSDLIYEASSTFYEHTTQQPGDVAVYRFFDNVHGTHFYTDDVNERANIAANRPDLVAEGVGFYEPPQNYIVPVT